MIKKILLVATLFFVSYSYISACDEMKNKDKKKSGNQTQIKQGKANSKSAEPKEEKTDKKNSAKEEASKS